MIQVVLPRLLKEGLAGILRRTELQQEHERDPYYLLKQRVNKAKVLAWNRRAKSALDFGKQFSNKKESVCQLELSFKLENLFISKLMELESSRHFSTMFKLLDPLLCTQYILSFRNRQKFQCG